ncbi:hypothetical protein N0V90_008079 [Kalmusia sp. IMI 367209]|nr:hypothetical protein N0V90_008079 [Kalmusia sp. IMI 367209]
MALMSYSYGTQILTRTKSPKSSKYWYLQDLDPLPTTTKGRALLSGDAAHAMLPLQGQGVNIAVEDAETLSLFTHKTTKE